MSKHPTRRLLNRTSDNNIEVLDSNIKSFVNSLQVFISSYYRDLLDELKDKKESSFVSQLGGIMEGMLSAGLDTELAKIRKLHQKELKKVQESFRDFAPSASIKSIADRDTVEAFIRFREADTVAKVEATISQVNNAILEQVVLGQTPVVRDIVSSIKDSIESNVKTELRTGLMKFNRTVSRIQAEELGLELGYYAGPIIANTRDFCRDLIESRDPPIYTLEEIEEMDNDQGLDVITSGGGYNCIHHWRWISEETARELGWEPE